MDRGALRDSVHGVAKSRTQLSDWARINAEIKELIPQHQIPYANNFVCMYLFRDISFICRQTYIYIGTSLVAQMVNHLPTIQETGV